MPNAGWCRECGEWIWVDEEGACQHGHGPECVDGIYEAQPRSQARSVGQGEMPAGFSRFNWGAFLLPFFWGLAYGVWPLVALWLLAMFTPIFLLMFAGAGGRSSIEASTIGITVVSEIVNGIARLYFGANANRLLWKRERLRLELIEGALPRVSVDRFIARQRVWVIVGGALMAFSVASVASLALIGGELGDTLRGQLAVTPADAGLTIVWLVAEVALGLWLAYKMRQESPEQESPGPAEDAV